VSTFSGLPLWEEGDLGSVLALGDPVADGDAVDDSGADDRDAARVRDERRRYRVWLDEARRLAALGVRPGPSHSPAVPGFVRHVSFWAGFADVETLAPEGLPVLVWGFPVEGVADVEELGPLPSGYVWRALAHQTTGLACRTFRVVGVLLESRPQAVPVLAGLAGFADRAGHDCVGIGGVSLSELAAYRDLLAAHGLTAEGCYQWLTEGVYPVDATEESLAALSSTPVPSSEELRAQRAAAASDEWSAVLTAWRSPVPTLFVLGANCD